MRILVLALLANAIMLANAVVAAPLVYTGNAVSFSKAGFADPTLPANQDRILSNIRITRAEIQGIFNIAQEALFASGTSPLGTAWAFVNNNPAATLSANNWATLTFADWVTANGGMGGGPLATVGQDAVLHLVDQDIYLDIRFTSWSSGFGTGGGFGYDRAELTPSADFDRDGDVDGRDFLTWQRNVGAANPLQSQGDANFDGSVNGADLEVWQGAYGGALTAFTAVPEPSGLLLAGFVSLIGVACRCHRTTRVPIPSATSAAGSHNLSNRD
ncbi:MAG: PEP-CTERM sorting domain-containing protein [Bythopirellula sp.]|nr:PEP-CTERM sorting domain-containing protein [Bythopirellula sp.]